MSSDFVVFDVLELGGRGFGRSGARSIRVFGDPPAILAMSLRPDGFIEPCLPTVSRTVMIGPGWLYEIKHDSFRFLAVRDGKRMRVFSRGGRDWSKQLPAIVEAMQTLPVRPVAIRPRGRSVRSGPSTRSKRNCDGWRTR